MTRIAPVAISTLVACLLWFVSVNLSDYLGRQYLRREAANAAQPTPAALAELEGRVDANPADEELRLQFARALYEEARKSASGQLVMRAVENYAYILRRDPNHREALLELAALCFEQGILDKAEEYLRRFIALDPEDVRARTDLALVLVQAGQPEESLGLLNAVIDKHPALFPPRFALALAYRVLGDLDSAKAAASAALPYAPDDTARQRLQTFLASLTEAAPASLEQYVRSHSILGPKVTKIEMTEEKTLQVTLREFPVEQMPDVAKKVFIAKLEAALKADKSVSRLSILDAASGRVLLELPASSSGGEIPGSAQDS